MSCLHDDHEYWAYFKEIKHTNSSPSILHPIGSLDKLFLIQLLGIYCRVNVYYYRWPLNNWLARNVFVFFFCYKIIMASFTPLAHLEIGSMRHAKSNKFVCRWTITRIFSIKFKWSVTKCCQYPAQTNN